MVYNCNDFKFVWSYIKAILWSAIISSGCKILLVEKFRNKITHFYKGLKVLALCRMNRYWIFILHAKNLYKNVIRHATMNERVNKNSNLTSLLLWNGWAVSIIFNMWKNCHEFHIIEQFKWFCNGFKYGGVVT